jgi:O-antigen ligase
MPQQMSQVASRSIGTRKRDGRQVMFIVALGTLACTFGFVVLAVLPDLMIGIETAEAFVACAVLMTLLIAPLAARARGVIDVRQQMLLTAILLFSFLLVAERIFYRYSTLGAAYQGDFAASAYAETMIWAMCSIVLLLITFRSPGYLGRLLKPSFRWLFLLAFVSIASAAYSPAKAFSFAWGFKLVLAVMLLRVILDEIESMNDLRWFLDATLWSFTALVALCLAQFIATPDAWSGGRMSEALSPTGVSAIAGTLFLLGLIFYAVKSEKKYLVFSGFGFFVMLLGGGKGAILAAFVAGTMFFILRKNWKSGLIFIVVVVGLGSILVVTTPLQHYLMDYAKSGEAETGTGRIGLWKVIIPAIMEKPLYGHGYVSSKFIAEDVSGVDWPAGHTHNGFLEILYNNGVIGLILLLAVLWRTVRNLLLVTRRIKAGEMRTWAIGCFAVFVFEMLNGMLNASFGGRPGSSYLMLISLLIVSEVLAGLLQRVIAQGPSQYEMAGSK